MASARDFFSKEEQKRIVDAIKKAEKSTSGEIRVHIDKRTKITALDRASFLFEKLGMHKTESRNGVLIFLSIENKLFSIIGDVGINAVVPDNFWEEQKNKITTSFKKGVFCEALVCAILEIGEKLREYFPYQSDDINELSDELSF